MQLFSDSSQARNDVASDGARSAAEWRSFQIPRKLGMTWHEMVRAPQQNGALFRFLPATNDIIVWPAVSDAPKPPLASGLLSSPCDRSAISVGAQP